MSIEILKSLVNQMEKEKDYIFDTINSDMEIKTLSFLNGRAIGLSDAIHLLNMEIEKLNNC